MKLEQLQVDSIIMDLDGTLWDSSQTCARAWNSVLEQHCSDLRVSADTLKYSMGLQDNQFADLLLKDIDEQNRYSIINECYEMELELIRQQGGNIFNGTIEILKQLEKRFNLYIVSNCQDGYIEAFLAYYKLPELITDFECSGCTGLEKSRNLGMVLDRNKIKKAAYVGDTETDLNAAHKNNLPFIWASYGFKNIMHYDYLIYDIRELMLIKSTRGIHPYKSF